MHPLQAGGKGGGAGDEASQGASPIFQQNFSKVFFTCTDVNIHPFIRIC